MQTHAGAQVHGLPEMSAISQIPSWLSDELKGASLVDKMLKIQRGYRVPHNRTTCMSWFERLECLSVHPTKAKVLTRAVRKVNRSRSDFVAVSYSFKSAEESLEKSTMGFEVRDTKDQFLKQVKTRDIVLERVIKYTEKVETPYFWIDQECLDQRDAEKLQEAMDSMNIVYHRSRYSVALLEIILESNEKELLDILMSGEYIRRAKIDSMVQMLKHIQGDKWWTRAWTFQEEYLAGHNMELLIRHKSIPGVRISSALGDMEGEARISATQFRDRVTDFLQDLIEKNATTEEFRVTCKTLLRPFRRYNLLEETTDLANRRAMSSDVFEDLECRGIDKPFDLLPIAANVCDYDVRLHSAELAKIPHSAGLVGLCILTMYLLNGEIFFNGELVRKLPTEKGLSEYIRYISPGVFIPPLGNGRLAWLKKCRLRPAKLSLEGIVTSGYLWHVYKRIRVTNSGHVPDVWDDSETVGLGTNERNRLFQLIDELEQMEICKELRDELVRYLKKDEHLQDGSAWPKSYMNKMAEEVVQAIGSGRSLYLAAHKASPKACAIFVMDTDRYASSDPDAKSNGYGPGKDVCQSEIDCQSGSSESFGVVEEDFCVFTSTSRRHHVSMTVDLAETASGSKSPLMTVTGWTNGLAFYDVKLRENLVVRWPEIWQQRVEVEQPQMQQPNMLKRRRSSESPRDGVM
jgi:hypothetical protein